jgi:hypothetical protein
MNKLDVLLILSVLGEVSLDDHVVGFEHGNAIAKRHVLK